MKKNSIVLLFSLGSPFVHECSANFRSLVAHFLWFLIKTTRNRKFFAQNFYHSGYFSTFLAQNFVRGGANFNFRTILTDFHEYTLNIMSYHVNGAINGYF